MSDDVNFLNKCANYINFLHERIDAQERTIMFLILAAILNAAGLIIISLSLTWGV